MAREDHYAAGLSLYRQGRYEPALEQLSQAAEQDGLDCHLARFYQAMSHRGLGIEALRDGRFAEAETHLRHAAATIGRTADLANYLAAIYARTGRNACCAKEAEKASELEPGSPAAWRRLALAQWQAGQRPQAHMTLAEAMRKLGGVAELHLQAGLFHAAEGHADVARASLARAVEADCTLADAHYYLALAAASQGDAPSAVRSFQRTCELRPTDVMVAYQLAVAARAAEQGGVRVALRLPETAAPSAGSEIRQLAQYVSREGEFIDAFLALPPSGMDEELFDLLAGVLRMAIDEHPDYADLHHRCSRVLHRLGRVPAAMEHAERAVQINGQYVAALKHVGELCTIAGRTADAIEHLERAIAAGGDWADVHCMLAELLRQSDSRDGAERHLRRALTLNANYTRAAEALASLAA